MLCPNVAKMGPRIEGNEETATGKGHVKKEEGRKGGGQNDN
jgi:hypothetical protein